MAMPMEYHATGQWKGEVFFMLVHRVSETYNKMKYTQGREPYIKSATFCVRKSPE